MEFFLGAFEREWEQRRAALLHELEMEQTHEFDQDWRRRGGMSYLPDGGRDRGRHSGGRPGFGAGKGVGRPMRARFEALARGSQPAVVKLASYGGGGRVGTMASYIAREGQLAMENERGERVSGNASLTTLKREWEHLFDNRAASRDVAVFNVTVGHVSFDRRDVDAVAHAFLQAGFGDRPFVFAIDKGAGDEITLHGVVVLRDRSGERLSGDSKAAEIVQQRFEESEFGSGVEAHFRFHGYGNGVPFATARVRDLVKRFDGEVRDETSRLVSTSDDAGQLVQKDWRHEMHSRKGRDVMHLIVSARVDTNLAGFQNAVRDFLAEQFAGHRYVFALHGPSDDPKEMAQGGKRPHIHAHAIVTMRAETGGRIVTSPQVFREWRYLMAEKAREHGINMELTDRREQASAPAYTRNQVRPVSFGGRTEHQGTSEAAQVRYVAKRENVETSVTTERSRTYVAAATAAWRELATGTEGMEVVSYAEQQAKRIINALGRLEKQAEMRGLPVQAPSNVVMLNALTEIENAAMQQMTRSEFEQYETRVEAVLQRFEATIQPWERQDYAEIAATARDVINIRREYLELSKRNPRTSAPRRQEVDNEAWPPMATPHGEQVVERTRNALLKAEFARETVNRTAPEASSAENRAPVERQPESQPTTVATNRWNAEIGEWHWALPRAIETTRPEVQIDRDRVTSADQANSDRMEDQYDGQTAQPLNFASGSGRAAGEHHGDLPNKPEWERALHESRTRDDRAPYSEEQAHPGARDTLERATRPGGPEGALFQRPQAGRAHELEVEDQQKREGGEREV
jgi:hypothetical protein